MKLHFYMHALKGKALLAGMLCLLLSLMQITIPVHAEEVREILMHRLYNPNSGEHFYTADDQEKNDLVQAGWHDEDYGWVAPSSGDPVYRLYNPNAGDHHYTLSQSERDNLVKAGWRYEGVGWYSDPEKTVPVYREYNPNAKSGAHNFTVDESEDRNLVSVGWRAEGIAWYALKKPPVVKHALQPLHVSGTRLLNADNQPVVLQGYSTFGLNYMPQYVDEGVFRFLKNQMGSQIVRLALYTQEYGGYCSGGNQQQLKALIDKGVNAAEKTGQYCIIDWHILSDGDPMIHVNEAKSFFDEMSRKYAGKDHVLYEICNEPNGVDWQRIKTYANQIIPVIRANDPDAVILVGTPAWSQDVDTAAQSPLTGVSNIMYTLHFYAATHKDGIRSRLKTAHAKGLPVFVSEFGISSADGNGQLDPNSGSQWIALLNQEGISRVGWALSNKNEASALFTPNSNTNLSLSSLSAAGRWFHQTYTGSQIIPDPEPDPQPQPDWQDPKKVTYSIAKVNGWKEGEQFAAQFDITISNPRAGPVRDWQVSIPFTGSFEIENSWNCTAEIENQTLILKPASYNAVIEAGGKAGNIGCILKSSQDIAPAAAPDAS